MSVVQYWRERLEASRPVRSDAYWVLDVHWKPHIGPLGRRQLQAWPKAVSATAIYLDYVLWHDEVYLAAHRDTPRFRDFPDQLERPLNDVEFWAYMGPLLHLTGNRRHTAKHFKVWTTVKHEGKWLRIKKIKRFILLGTLKEHRAAFDRRHIPGGATPSASWKS